MTEDNSTQRYKHEREARESAERLLETTSKELFLRNQELNQLKAQIEALVVQRTLALSKARDNAEAASRAKSRFLANMSHEIRTPLTSIIGFAQIIQDSFKEEPKTQRYARNILNSSRYLASRLTDILDVTKIESNNLVIETVTFDLPYLLKEIEETYVLLAQDKALGFSIQLDSPIPQRITSDPLRLKQILTNLLNNAIRYTKEGNVKTSVRYTPDNQTLLFKVIDTGPGLELLAQKQIFNAFHQTSSNTTSEHQGAGLGLFICKSLSALLGGSIDVTSKIGEGSQFTFSIQCQQPSGQCDNLDNVPLAQPTTYDVPRLKGNILLVEDTLINQELFTHNIEVTGASVVIAQNGQQGLQEVLENDYSLVLMDIQMPVMDGKQAIKAMRQLGCNLPVYALTANVNSTDIAEYKALGFDGILAKPLEMEQFYHALEQCLAGPNEHAKEKPKPSDGLVHLRQQFLQDLCEQRYQLEHFLAQNSLSEVSKIVHVIKGVAGGFGFNALTEQAQHCLLSLRTGHDEQAVVLTKSLCDHIEMLLKQEQEHDEAH